MVVNVSLGLLLPPSGSGSLSLEGNGLQSANSVPSFFLCTVLAVSYVRAFRVVAIPQSGFLAQVSWLWLRSGHSGPILEKHCSLCLPAQPSLASGGCRHLLLLLHWGSYWWARNLLLLIIYFSSLLCCPLCFQGSPQTWLRECFLVFGSFSLFKTSFPRRSSLPISFVSFFPSFVFFLPDF